MVRSDDALQGRAPSNHYHLYQIAGTENTRRTHTNNLIHKVEEAHRAPPPAEPMVAEEKEPLFRYFRNNMRCFRCKKEGHHNYACLQEPQCLYCLSPEHSSERCPQRTVCYQCYQYGHVVNECTQPPGNYCNECKRKHTKMCCFLTKGIEPIKQMFNTDCLYQSKDIRCMRCLQTGHLYCNREERDRPM